MILDVPSKSENREIRGHSSERTGVLGLKSYSRYSNSSGSLLLKGEIFEKLFLEEILARIYDGGSFETIAGQFSAVLILQKKIVAYRGTFSPHLLYFNEKGEISDELIALVGQTPNFSFEYLEKFVVDYPCLQSSSTLTPLKGVERLLPGAILEIARRERPHQRILPFKTFTPVEADQISREEAAERTREKLKEVLLSYLAKDKPIFAELSGGLDSSFVCSYLGELTSKPVRAHMFSYRKHPSHTFSENCAKIVAKEKQIDLTIIDAADVRVPLLSDYQPPYQDEPSETYWLGVLFGPILRERLEEGGQLFSGFGCDQIFMRGHEILSAVLRRRQFSKLWPLIKAVANTTERPTFNFLFQFMVSSLPRKTLARLLDRTRNVRLNPFKIDELVPHIRRFSRVEWIKEMAGVRPSDWLCILEDEGERLERRIFREDIPHSHINYLLAPHFVLGAYVARNTEYVHPFCDQRMIEFAFREVPWEYIHDYANPYKQLLREAQKGIVPDEIRLRSHNDFSFDGYYYSFLTANRQFLYELLLEAFKEFPDWIEPRTAQVSFEKMLLGSYENSELKLARLLGYLVWRHHFSRHVRAR